LSGNERPGDYGLAVHRPDLLASIAHCPVKEKELLIAAHDFPAESSLHPFFRNARFFALLS